MSIRSPELTLPVAYRQPRIEDAPQVWSLVKKTGVLDVNSSYSYLMMSNYFGETCIVSEHDNRVIGYISGFIVPNRENVLFVWQVAVDERYRGYGVASNMLSKLLQREACKQVQYVETTVSPDNKASEAMFRRLADNLQTRLEVVGQFRAQLLPPDGHENERIFVIGPFHAETAHHL
ncbi:diaminobutyrate acetyltransferase [Alicyclobacillus sp. SO9]|uniref:diaminobutyrate acetyltransferase n=1 Tax=Alicyclobacillus sp. SO9 TaxID=2665646 RepID=UPI0018E725CF|nr:diaminobutyrate acetyltransferase [Alicyclobacillus sp. SO9]QQE81086.1 diaminobutyrate acetyltransferase [Alicyclobacillus sp. SO9]